MSVKCILLISSDLQTIKISSLDGDVVYFEGDEEQAYRVSKFVSVIVGGNRLYACCEGELIQAGMYYFFTAENACGMGVATIVEFDDKIRKCSNVWRE